MADDQQKPAKKGPRVTIQAVRDLSLTLTSVIAAAFLLSRMLYGPPVPTISAPPSVYQPNEVLPQQLPIQLMATERALLISVSSRCVYCTNSMSFYKTLESVHGANTKLVVVGKEEAVALQEYVARHSFRPDGVASVPGDYFKTSVTPLLVLVDSKRRVLNSWVGFLNPRGEQDVLRALKGG